MRTIQLTAFRKRKKFFFIQLAMINMTRQEVFETYTFFVSYIFINKNSVEDKETVGFFLYSLWVMFGSDISQLFICLQTNLKQQ